MSERKDRINRYRQLRSKRPNVGVSFYEAQAMLLTGVLGDLMDKGVLDPEQALRSYARFVNLSQVLGLENVPKITDIGDKKTISQRVLLLNKNRAFQGVLKLIMENMEARNSNG